MTDPRYYLSAYVYKHESATSPVLPPLLRCNDCDAIVANDLAGATVEEIVRIAERTDHSCRRMTA